MFEELVLRFHSQRLGYTIYNMKGPRFQFYLKNNKAEDGQPFSLWRQPWTSSATYYSDSRAAAEIEQILSEMSSTLECTRTLLIWWNCFPRLRTQKAGTKPLPAFASSLLPWTLHCELFVLPKEIYSMMRLVRSLLK